jgi:hypothetical protein
LQLKIAPCHVITEPSFKENVENVLGHFNKFFTNLKFPSGSFAASFEDIAPLIEGQHDLPVILNTALNI